MKQTGYLPYLKIDKEFSFDTVIFWPFWRLKGRRIKEELVLKHLEWYFKKWKHNIHYKRLDITIASLRDKLLGPFSDDERERIQVACNILFLLSVRNFNELNPLSSDNFMLYFQNFREGEFGLSLSTGSYIRQDAMISSEIVNKIKFIKPDYIPSHRTDTQPWFSDKKYFRAIQKAFNREYNQNWFVRFKRSLGSFISSYSNVYSLSYFDRIVSLVTAIEILLDIDTSSSSRFVGAIESILGFSNSLCRRNSGLANTNRNIRRFSNALYGIRSKYVHGEEMTQEDVNHSRFGEYYKAGVIFYYELVKCILENNSYLRKRRIIEKKIYFDFFLFPYRERN